MLLIGMYDSPYVRRVAITLKLLEVPFDHGNWSVGADFDRIREYSPLGRVPVLVMTTARCWSSRAPSWMRSTTGSAQGAPCSLRRARCGAMHCS